jgi:hypothetical protein
MSEFKISDAAVEAAMLGEQKFYAEKRYRSFRDVSANDAANAMRAALAAAMPVMLEIAGYMDPDDGSVAAESYAHEPRYASYTTPLYRLKDQPHDN